MNRLLFALVLGVGLGATGCATAVDDPVVPDPAPVPQRDPPQQTLRGQLQLPQLQLISTIENNTAALPIGAKQRPPIPHPNPGSDAP